MRQRSNAATGGVSVWTLVRRALRTHRSAALLLAAVIAVGAFLGAAAPRWSSDHLDQTLREVVASAGSRAELSARSALVPDPNQVNAVLPALRADAGTELERLLGEGRWAVSTTSGQILMQNDVATDDGQFPRQAALRVPDDLAARVRLVDGAMPAAVESVTPPAALATLPVPEVDAFTIIDVVTTPEVAEALKLTVGDVVMFEHKSREATAISAVVGGRQPVGARLTGLVEPVDPDDPAWADATTAIAPDLGSPGEEPRVTSGTLLSDPDLLLPWTAATDIYLDGEWHVPVDASLARADEVDAVAADLRRIATGSDWRSGLTDLLSTYTERRAAAEGVVAFGIVSIAALCAALVLLATRMIADRRVDEAALARTRGAGDVALGRMLAIDAAVVSVPAAALGGAVAVALIPGRSSPLSFAVPVLLTLAAVVALPIMTIRQARRAGPGGGEERADVTALRPSPRRLVLEAGVVVIALIGLWLAGSRTPSPGGGVDLVVSLAPVLVAAAAGLLIFRVMPYLVAVALPWLRRRSGLTAFLAFTRTSRAPAHAVLPVIALLMAVGVAAFGGTVHASVVHAREVSSWDQVGGDALVRSDVIRVSPEQIAAIPGATFTALGHTIDSQRPRNLDNGRQSGVDVLAIDVDGWQEVTAAAPEPVDPLPALTSPTPSGEYPAVLQGSVEGIGVGDRLEIALRGVTVTVEVVQQLASVPGADTSATVVIPLAPVAEANLGPANVVYVGGDVDPSAVAEALGITADEVTSRAGLLAAIADDPVLGTVLDAFTIIGIVAAVLAAAAAVLGLAVGERTRAYGLSILRTLGLTTRQSAALTAADVVPTSIIAAVAGVGIGLGVGVVAAGALDLSALSGVISGDTEIVTDAPGAVRAAAVVLAVVLVAVVVTVIANRRAKLGSVLRAGEQA